MISYLPLYAATCILVVLFSALFISAAAYLIAEGVRAELGFLRRELLRLGVRLEKSDRND
ncbi:hypothetical protein EBX31_07270 [bacterium]|nr:hypothetical protein [bacterium]